MDGSRFDSLTRTMAISRRGALRTLLGAVVAGIAATAGSAAGSAADEADKDGQADAARRRPFWRRGEPCTSNQQCGRLVPCTLGICTAIRCDIDGETYPVGRNPNNSCEYCVPSRDPGVPDAWQPFPVGFACPDDFEATACLIATATCNADSECVQTPEPDGTLCGPGQTCCGGVCCTATQCCNAAGSCEECGLHCVIEGVTYPNLITHPDGLCLFCDAEADFSFWTGLPDKAGCGPNRDLFCCSGNCCDLGQCCDESGQCAECETSCTIDGVPYDDGEINDDVPCQVCDPSRSTFAWSVTHDNLPCGPLEAGLCCDGVCCDPGECCQDLVCSADNCLTCTIDGIPYPDGAYNPGNLCEVCTADIINSVTVWTVKPNNDDCGPNMDRLCCGGACLPLGEECCATSDGNRVSGECSIGCTIDSVDYDEGAPNPENACEICNTADPETWTLQPDNAPCGDAQGQVCCGGACCGPDQCCNPAGQCEMCAPGCMIDSVHYDDGMSNPNNYCEMCDSSLDPTSWSPRTNEAPCGRDEARVCCNGTCCDPDVCCTADGTCGSEACVPEGCTIDGASYEYGAHNPGNECQLCDPGNSTTSWSSDLFGSCGANGDQFCCNGVCCDLGVCCNLGALVCDPEYCRNCVIGDAVYLPGDRNPANGCEQCNDTISRTAWSLVPPNYFCDDTQDRVCCAGTCCTAGVGCNTNEGFVCDPELDF